MLYFFTRWEPSDSSTSLQQWNSLARISKKPWGQPPPTQVSIGINVEDPQCVDLVSSPLTASTIYCPLSSQKLWRCAFLYMSSTKVLPFHHSYTWPVRVATSPKPTCLITTGNWNMKMNSTNVCRRQKMTVPTLIESGLTKPSCRVCLDTVLMSKHSSHGSVYRRNSFKFFMMAATSTLFTMLQSSLLLIVRLSRLQTGPTKLPKLIRQNFVWLGARL